MVTVAARVKLNSRMKIIISCRLHDEVEEKLIIKKLWFHFKIIVLFKFLLFMTNSHCSFNHLFLSNTEEINYVSLDTVEMMLYIIVSVLCLYILFILSPDTFEIMPRIFSVLNLYFIPAALYCLYNNLQFVNLSAYDPTTYYLLLQFRVVVTGVIFQVND